MICEIIENSYIDKIRDIITNEIEAHKKYAKPILTGTIMGALAGYSLLQHEANVLDDMDLAIRSKNGDVITTDQIADNLRQNSWPAILTGSFIGGQLGRYGYYRDKINSLKNRFSNY